ncbi:peptidoglycan DD-metalloendopeptidase family protein [Streptomyces sp. NPDC048659]|uniref:M23 family metallopeptidase n=1 Tax=Streptomyces sp. NPDC048659 TaxID=3155489 RepID=UPI0034337421
MNDQHPHAGYVTDATQITGSFTADPRFGGYDADYAAGLSAGQSMYGGYTEHTGYADPNGYAGHTDPSGHWDTGSHGSYSATGQWDATAWSEAQQTGQYEAVAFAATAYDTTGQWTTPGFETGTYDMAAATAWHQAPTPEPVVPQQYTPGPEHTAYATEAPGHVEHTDHTDHTDHTEYVEHAADYADYTDYAGHTEHFEHTEHVEHVDHPEYSETMQVPAYDGYGAYDADPETDRDADPDAELHAFHAAETMVALEVLPEGAGSAGELPPVAGRPVRRSSGGARGGRRRTPAKRSALLTVAVPSACVMGVAGIAAASVGGLTDSGTDAKDTTTTMAAADPASVKEVAANTKLDTQLAALSADARSFGDRASRTQERIDLRVRQDAEKKKREEEAARKEALRPKFMLPVKLHQLSARFGQSGVNWMSVHTGIDFPVQYGTPVMAATDGTVRTQWNSAYGNMAIVTMADGTETWYCHLSSTKIRSGKVKAGEVIAYSGNSGNSTGPHLHFEVRPNGGAAIDPLPWLLSRGLDPTG